MLSYMRAILRNGFFLTAVTILGAAGSAAGVVASALGHLPAVAWSSVIGGSFLTSAVLSRPKWSEAYDFNAGGWRIEVARGDLFEQSVAIVVTTDQAMTTLPTEVGHDSLVGQLIGRWYEGDSVRFNDSIEGGRRGGAPGLTAPFSSGPSRRGWLLSLARKDAGASATSWQELAVAHESLWAEVRRANSKVVAVPVLGAGFAHAKLPYRALALMLAMSFHAASLDGRVCNTLRIVMAPEDFDPRVLKTLGTLLEALEYERR